ncbi:MAG: endolytic transglycosylase MltG [Bacteroidia bacterium]|nr:endolytic transglycosylase MltG [Bacteroidia bacterium]
MTAPKKNRKTIRIIFVSVIVILALAALTSYTMVKGKAITIDSQKYLVLPAGSTLADLENRLVNEFGLKYPKAFHILAQKMNLGKHLRAGRYTLMPGMNNLEIVRHIRSGGLRTTDLVIRGLMSKRDLCNLLGKNLEPDAEDYMYYLSSIDTARLHGFNDSNSLCMVIPDTYNVYWMSNPDDLFKKLYGAYKKYWNETRLQKAKAAGLTPVQVSILASIVDKETSKEDEMATVAGLYINRLKQGIKLQSDPTVKYAIDSPLLKRIYDKHTNFPSPYNTYYVKGLPPGPLCIPSMQSLNAVLNYQEHNYIFMCAKPDFSGYHNFAVTDKEHALNAKRYHDALDRLKASQGQ